jgi:quinol monooxygenase YgiN
MPDPKMFLERHIDSTYYQDYVAAVDGMIEEKSVRKMTCIA